MSLSGDNLVQPIATGTFEASSGTVSLGSVTAGNTTVLICATVGGPLGSVGFTGVTGGAGTFDRASRNSSGASTRNNVAIYLQRRVAAGEQSWTLNLSGSGQVVWAVMELNGVGVSPYTTLWYVGVSGDQLPAADTLVGSKTTGLTPLDTATPTVCYDAMAIQIFGATSADTTVPVVSGYDSIYTEALQNHHTNASRSVTLALAFAQILDVGNFTATATVSPTAYVATDMILLYADNAKFVPHIRNMTGLEFATETGITNGPTGQAPFDGSAGTPQIDTAFPRTGTYSLKISTAAAAENVYWNTNSIAAQRCLPVQLHVYFDSLPAGDAELYSSECANSYANGVKLTYRSASQKLELQVDSGTAVLSDAVVAAGEHIGVDLRIDFRGQFGGGGGDGSHHYCDWQIDYDSLDGVGPVAQTTATGTLTSTDNISTIKFGTTQSQTYTAWFDDLAVGYGWEHYPVDPLRIVRVQVDSGGTCTVNGATNDFKTSTNNGSTLTSWTSANTLAVLDEAGAPTVGASADVLIQASPGATEYVQVPFATFTEAPDKALRAVKVYFAGWKASAAAATIRFMVLDADGNVLADSGLGDFAFDNATLRWWTDQCGFSNNQFYYRLSQARLDGLVARIGFSDDATPDVGCHAVFLEVAYTPTVTQVNADGEDGTFNLYSWQDPTTRVVKGLSLSTPVGTRGATMMYTKGGSLVTRSVSAGSLFNETVAADLPGDVTSIGMAVDPTV